MQDLVREGGVAGLVLFEKQALRATREGGHGLDDDELIHPAAHLLQADVQRVELVVEREDIEDPAARSGPAPEVQLIQHFAAHAAREDEARGGIIGMLGQAAQPLHRRLTQAGAHIGHGQETPRRPAGPRRAVLADDLGPITPALRARQQLDDLPLIRSLGKQPTHGCNEVGDTLGRHQGQQLFGDRAERRQLGVGQDQLRRGGLQGPRGMLRQSKAELELGLPEDVFPRWLRGWTRLQGP